MFELHEWITRDRFTQYLDAPLPVGIGRAEFDGATQRRRTIRTDRDLIVVFGDFDGELNAGDVATERGGGEVAPFDQGNSTLVENFLESELNDLARFVEAPAVDMRNEWLSLIEVTDNKGRTRHFDGSSQLGDESFHESGFSRPELTGEHNHVSGLHHRPDECPKGPRRIRRLAKDCQR